MDNMNVDELLAKNAALKQSVITMAVEAWRLCSVLDRLLLSVDVKESQRYQSKIRWFLKKAMEALTTAGIEFKQIGDCNKPSQFHEALTAAVEVSFVQFPRYIGRPPKASITPAPSRRGII